MRRLTDAEWREVCNLLASPTTGAAAPGLRKLLENYQAELEQLSYRSPLRFGDDEGKPA